MVANWSLCIPPNIHRTVTVLRVSVVWCGLEESIASDLPEGETLLVGFLGVVLHRDTYEIIILYGKSFNLN